MPRRKAQNGQAPRLALGKNTYVVTLDQNTATKYENARKDYGLPIADFIAGAAAHMGVCNHNTATDLDPEVALWLIESSVEIRRARE